MQVKEGPYYVMRSVKDKTDTAETTDGTIPAVSPAPATLSHPLPVTIADIWEAHKLLKPRLHHTALEPSRTLHDITGADIYLKAEHMQRSGSFKVRGASFKVSRLSQEERRHGVIAASAGNHAQGVAIAAAQAGIPCTIVMPE